MLALRIDFVEAGEFFQDAFRMFGGWFWDNFSFFFHFVRFGSVFVRKRLEHQHDKLYNLLKSYQKAYTVLGKELPPGLFLAITRDDGHL